MNHHWTYQVKQEATETLISSAHLTASRKIYQKYNTNEIAVTPKPHSIQMKTQVGLHLTAKHDHTGSSAKIESIQYRHDTNRREASERGCDTDGQTRCCESIDKSKSSKHGAEISWGNVRGACRGARGRSGAWRRYARRGWDVSGPTAPSLRSLLHSPSLCPLRLSPAARRQAWSRGKFVLVTDQPRTPAFFWASG